MSYRRRAAQPAKGSAAVGPDPGHGCADPSRCTRPFCAAPVDVRLVAPEDSRVVVRELAGWPLSASALFDRLNGRIARDHLLHIASYDPLGAHQHFPILVRIRLSGQVPAKLAFDPGEALRLARWGSGPDVDHLVRAWCCTLLVIAPDDDLADSAAQLAESCLALGGDLPPLAEQLLVWRAVTEKPDLASYRSENPAGADPVALLTLLLLRAATDPADARLVGLARTLADEDFLWLTESVSRRWWKRLINTVLTPLRSAHPDLDRLADTLSQAFRKR